MDEGSWIDFTLGRLKDSAATFDLAVKSIKTVLEIAKPGKPVSAVDGEARKVLTQAYDQMLLLKQQQYELVCRLEAFEAEKALFEARQARLREFEAERDSYIVETLAPHAYAMSRKPVSGSAGDPRKFCIDCFGNKKLSTLQLKKREFNLDTLQCHECGATVRCANDNPAESFVVPVRNKWRESF